MNQKPIIWCVSAIDASHYSLAMIESSVLGVCSCLLMAFFPPSNTKDFCYLLINLYNKYH